MSHHVESAASRETPAARLALAVALSLVLHTTAALVAAATPERSIAAGAKPPALAPLQTRLAADTRPGTASTGSSVAPSAKAGDASGKPAGGVTSAVYYKRSQLDDKPYLVTHVKPEYPTGVPPTGGRARIRLFIDERGRVDRVDVVDSPSSARFGEAAATAFRAARFEPGKRGGVAVKSQIQIEMDFAPLLPTKPGQ